MPADLKMQLFVDKVPQLVGPDDLAVSGFMYAAMTDAERDAIAQPAAGMVRYNSTTNKLNLYNGTAWEEVTSTVVVAGGMSRAGNANKTPEHKTPEHIAKATPAPTDHHNK